VGNPLERFGEDGLRPLRCARFAAQLGFSVEKATADAIPQTLSITEKVAFERRRDEIDKIIASQKPSTGFLFMEKTGLLSLLLPELADCRNIDQKGFHSFDVLDHSLMSCDYAARENYPHIVRIAALFHDIGKPLVRKMGESKEWTFYKHEKVSEELARNILTRYRYPNAVIDETARLIAEHMFYYEDQWTDAAVRRFIMRVGETHLPNLYRLRYADSFGLSGREPAPDSLAPLLRRVERILAEANALSIRDLAVSGNDLIALGVKPGPRLGAILKELLETAVDDPAQNERERLLEIAGKLAEKYGNG
jgi:putative nucleotidyltransferase with HDIG domain